MLVYFISFILSLIVISNMQEAWRAEDARREALGIPKRPHIGNVLVAAYVKANR